MMYEGINFNEDWIKSQTQDEFLSEVEVNKETWWPNDPNRVDKANAVYLLLMPKAKAGVKKAPAKALTDKENDIHGDSPDDQQV